jgi:hypothetical protein
MKTYCLVVLVLGTTSNTTRQTKTGRQAKIKEKTTIPYHPSNKIAKIKFKSAQHSDHKDASLHTSKTTPAIKQPKYTRTAAIQTQKNHKYQPKSSQVISRFCPPLTHNKSIISHRSRKVKQ